MAVDKGARLLTIDTGSSSLKCSIFEDSPTMTRLFTGSADGIGSGTGRIVLRSEEAATTSERTASLPEHGAALTAILDWAESQGSPPNFRGAGHRIVDGGIGLFEPCLATPKVLDRIREWVPFDPEHLPQALLAIELIADRYPEIPQVVCFDTAFHRTMPPVARRYPIPRKYRDAGVERLGFHGLSYEFIVGEVRARDPDRQGGRMVIAHLGSGSSMAAVVRGVGIDTTMGFTPTGGLVMGSRSGDLDPGTVLFLMERFGLDRSNMSHLLNVESGLLALSGSTGDMQALLLRRRTDTAANEAVESFCYQARKTLGALTAVLGGLDTLVFTGGIGENSAEVREGICQGLEFLGLRLDPLANRSGRERISTPSSSVTAWVLKTDENRVIARHLRECLGQGR
jgi:acetate kinase